MVSQNYKSFKDSLPARYRTSTFPMFPYHQLKGPSVRGNTTIQNVYSSMKKEDVGHIPRKHEEPRPLHAQQPIIVEKNSALTPDVNGDESMELLEKKKMEKMMNDVGRRKDSYDKYRGHIPTLVKVRQKSLPPVTNPKQCNVKTRQTSMASSDKRRKSQPAKNLNVTQKSRMRVDHVPARDPGLVYSKPRFQSAPYEAKPFKLLPPIAPKMREKKSTKEQVHDGGETRNKRSAFIAVRHTKKSAQIESRAKAKLDAEKTAILQALAKVKQPLESIATTLASKTQCTASGFTASDWSTTCIASSSPQTNASIPPIPQMAHTFNATLESNGDNQTPGKASVSVNVPTCPQISSARDSSLSRSSKVSQAVEIRRSGRDQRSRPNSVSSSRSTRSAERSTRTPESSSSIGPSPRTSSQNSLAVRSAPTSGPSSNALKKSARLGTPGSCKQTNIADDRKTSTKSSTSKYREAVRSVTRRSGRDDRSRSPSPSCSRKSSRCSQPGSARSKTKVKSDKSGPNASEHSDYKSDCSPLSTDRSVHTSRPPSISSHSASTSRSVPERSRNASRMKTATSSRGSSCTSKMSNLGSASPVKRDMSRESSSSKYSETVRSVSTRSRRDGRSRSPSPRGSKKSSRCSQPGSARSKMKAKSDKSGPNASKHSDYKSDYSPLSTARSTHTSRHPSVSSGCASTSRPSTALKILLSTVHNRPSTAPLSRASTSLNRPSTAPVRRPSTALSHNSFASDRPNIASSSHGLVSARHSNSSKTAALRPNVASVRPNIAPVRPITVIVSQSASSVRPKTDSVRPSTAPNSQTTASVCLSTASISHSTASPHQIPLSDRSISRIKASPVNKSPRSSNSICSVTPLLSNRSHSRTSKIRSNRS